MSSCFYVLFYSDYSGIIADPRTLNKGVHVYNEIYTRSQVYEVLERPRGERIPRKYVKVTCLLVTALDKDD
jgi:hypothetical protein